MNIVTRKMVCNVCQNFSFLNFSFLTLLFWDWDVMNQKCLEAWETIEALRNVSCQSNHYIMKAFIHNDGQVISILITSFLLAEINIQQPSIANTGLLTALNIHGSLTTVWWVSCPTQSTGWHTARLSWQVTACGSSMVSRHHVSLTGAGPSARGGKS